jgi:general secretion pathway protein D
MRRIGWLLFLVMLSCRAGELSTGTPGVPPLPSGMALPVSAPVQSVQYQDAGVIFQVQPTVKRDVMRRSAAS